MLAFGPTPVRRMVAPGGQLLVISGIREEGEHVDGPPWPLTHAELVSFADDGLRAVQIEQAPDVRRWRALFQRH